MLHCYCALQAVCPVHLSSCTQMFVPFTHNIILCSIHIDLWSRHNNHRTGFKYVASGTDILFSSWLWTSPWYCACAPFGDAHALFTLLTCMLSGHQGPSLLLAHAISGQGFLEGCGVCVWVCVREGGVFIIKASYY